MTLFANLTLEGLPELVPGRLFTTRFKPTVEMEPLIIECFPEQ